VPTLNGLYLKLADNKAMNRGQFHSNSCFVTIFA